MNSSPEPDLTAQEVTDLWIRNEGGRFVLIGRLDEVKLGRALIFDTATRTINWIDEADDRHRAVVIKMLEGGAKVEPEVPLP